mmetsp:Transcript_9703/g.36052  ORF Transcript_9703/g.36052 Transcript_9703/m.36052 type:complete len:868 (-) Transcript_9703:4126-6729(-)
MPPCSKPPLPSLPSTSSLPPSHSQSSASSNGTHQARTKTSSPLHCCSQCHERISPIMPKTLIYVPVIVSQIHNVLQEESENQSLLTAAKDNWNRNQHGIHPMTQAHHENGHSNMDEQNSTSSRATNRNSDQHDKADHSPASMPHFRRLMKSISGKNSSIICKYHIPKAPEIIDFFSPIYDRAAQKAPSPRCLSCFSEYHAQLRQKQHGQSGPMLTIKYIPIDKASSRALTFKWTPHATKYSVVSGILKKHGFQKMDSHETGFNIMWGLHASESEYFRMNQHQRVNHWLGSTNLGRKDLLFINLDRARTQSGSKEEWSFFPRSYFFPRDRDKLIAKMNMKKRKKLWIVKPRADACGRNISITSNLHEVDRQRECLVQEYIDRPLTIDGKKFDLRLYVLVTSYNPLTVFIYSTGLVRFASETYSPTSTDIYAALTNYSLNKKSKNFVKNTDALRDGEGSKWSCTALRRWFKRNGISDTHMWQQSYDIIVKTIISVESRVNALTSQYVLPENRNTCFEIYGFDILIDENLSPHLVEVNIGPSLSVGSPLDKLIKSNLIRNVLQVTGVEAFDRDEMKRKKNAYAEISKLSTSLDYSMMDFNSKFKLQTFKNNRKAVVEELPYVRPLRELKALNQLDYLTVQDKQIILDLETAYNRRQDFIRLFPTASSEKRYKKYFMTNLYSNQLVFLWMRETPERQRELMRMPSPFIIKRHPVKSELSQSPQQTARRSTRSAALSQQRKSFETRGIRPSSSLRHRATRRAASSMDLRRSVQTSEVRKRVPSSSDEVVPETDEDAPPKRRSHSSIRFRSPHHLELSTARARSAIRRNISVSPNKDQRSEFSASHHNDSNQTKKKARKSYNYIRETFRYVYS